MQETWKPIPGYEDYEVSNQGRVRSLKTDRPHILAPFNGNGYPFVSPCRDGRYLSIAIHRLVLLAFCGEPELGQEVCHNNGQKDDNRLDNLRYDTHQENMNDAVRHGNHSWSRVAPDETIVEIREQYVQGDTTYTNLANEYDMDVSAISLIVNGKRRIKAGGPIKGIDYNTKRPFFYLDAEQRARKVRKMYATGDYTMDEIAEHHDLSNGQVSVIVNGHQHKNAGGPIKGVDY